MELLVANVGPSQRYVTAITSAAPTFLDLSEFAGRYVEIYVNQAAYVKQLATGSGHTFSTSGAQAPSQTQTVHVPKRLAKDTALHRFISRANKFLMLQAQSTDITSVEVISASDFLDV